MFDIFSNGLKAYYSIIFAQIYSFSSLSVVHLLILLKNFYLLQYF